MARVISWIELVSGNGFQTAQLPQVCLSPSMPGSFLLVLLPGIELADEAIPVSLGEN